ncbi:MAG TPA: methyltransferase domain-containing protein [Dongiaceae bacterium]|jgi:phosphatidylethanolamine/phosphatidyl-N-methylethanolamine N-methyltransferase|nr:methyltransferase domain-containing protein [Dongiaceae bacterium]
MFRRWMAHPRSIGAIVPSSARLAQAMARTLRAEGALGMPGAVIELGGGTGVVTDALLAQGVPAERLIVLERDPFFAALLNQRFPGIRVFQADAEHLGQILAERGVDQVAAIVSSLPLLAMAKPVRQRIARECATVLQHGPLIQFTYGPGSPLPYKTVGLGGRAVRRVLRNVPPATIWLYRRA